MSPDLKRIIITFGAVAAAIAIVWGVVVGYHANKKGLLSSPKDLSHTRWTLQIDGLNDSTFEIQKGDPADPEHKLIVAREGRGVGNGFDTVDGSIFGSHIKFELRGGAVFEADVTSSGDEMNGTFTASGHSTPFSARKIP
jgi:hypothetical protein